MKHKKLNILFVCHGNICRSPMAEMIFKKMVRDNGLEDRFEHIDSAATSTEEIGNDIYPPAKRCLHAHNIPMERRGAWQMRKSDYERYDLIYVMDRNNLRMLNFRMPEVVTKSHGEGPFDTHGKLWMLMSLTGDTRDVADPWYTGDFEKTYQDITLALTELLKKLPL